MKNRINFYTDFNLDLVRKLLLIKHKILSFSQNFVPERIQIKPPNNKLKETCIIWYSLESFKNSYIHSGKINQENWYF